MSKSRLLLLTTSFAKLHSASNKRGDLLIDAPLSNSEVLPGGNLVYIAPEFVLVRELGYVVLIEPAINLQT